MKKIKKNKIVLMLVSLVLSVVLMACENQSNTSIQTENSASQSSSEEIDKSNLNEEDNKSEMAEYTDDAGRIVEVPNEIETVLGTGSTSQAVLYTLVPDKMIGWNNAPTEEELEYLPENAAEMPEVGSLFAKGEQMSPEEVAELNPDLIIDIGDVKPDLEEDLNRLQEDTGIPVIFFTGGIDDMPNLYEKAGNLLNVDITKHVEYIDEKLSYVQNNREELQKNPKEYYLESGDSTLMTAPAGSFQTATLDYIGMTNIFTLENGEGLGWQEVSPEQVIEWDPEVVIFHPNAGFYERDDTPWNTTVAYETGQIYEVPEAPFNWLSGSVNRILGLTWAGNLVYPEVYDINMIEEAQYFYDLFYHYDLTEEQAKELMRNSTYLTE